VDLSNFFEEWASSIDIIDSRVIKHPSYIFLCGGPTLKKSSHHGSFRDVFYKYINNNTWEFRENVVLAENIFSFLEHSGYNDLIEFEKDIANLCALTIIFSESPGSIAEFGSFSVMEEIWKNLFVIIRRDETDKDSFIWRGPALYLIGQSQ